MALEVAGYVDSELIGFGGTGEVWRAREVASGEVVALKRLRSSDHPAARDRLRRAAAVLTTFAGPHVLPLRGVLSTADGPVLVLDYAAGGSLAALRADRARLAPGEVVTLGLPLATTLADLHARGLVHGRLSPSNVLLTADGRPLLADLGIARLVADGGEELAPADGYADPAVLAGGAVTAASDTFALGVLLIECLTGQPFSRSPRTALVDAVPPPVAAVLTRAVSADAAARPAVTELAEAVRRLGPPVPLRLGLAHREDVDATALAHPRQSPLPPRRRAAVALLALGGMASAVLVGLLLSRHTPTEAVSAAPLPAVAPVNWTAVLSELDQTRDEAFVAGDPDQLAAVYAPGSAALRLEVTRMRALLDQRLVVRGLQTTLVRVVAVRAGPARAVLTVTDRRSAYDLLDATGRLVLRRPARGEHTWRVELVKQGRAWRVAAVS